MNAEFSYTRKIYNVDLEQFKMDVENLESLFKQVNDLRNSYKCGIIYCYHIEPEDYGLLTYRVQNPTVFNFNPAVSSSPNIRFIFCTA
jgi:hypothetical protein